MEGDATHMMDDVVKLVPPEKRAVKGMTREEIRRELQQRGLQPNGIHGEDSGALAAAFAREFEEEEREHHEAKRKEALRIQLEEDRLRGERRRISEAQHERQLVKSDPVLRVFLERARVSQTGPEATFTGALPALCRAVAACLPGCSSLVALDLSNGQIGDSGTEALGRALKQPTTMLKRLDLNRCGVGSNGAFALGEALAENQHLSALSLEDNDLTDKHQVLSGVDKLADALAANTALEWLSLARAELGAKGLELVAGGMAANSTLLALDVDFNGASKPQALRAIAAKIESNRAAQEARLGQAKLDDRALKGQRDAERQQVGEEKQRAAYEAECDARAAQRHDERTAKLAQDKLDRAAYLDEARLVAGQRQTDFEETELKRKNKAKNKAK